MAVARPLWCYGVTHIHHIVGYMDMMDVWMYGYMDIWIIWINVNISIS